MDEFSMDHRDQPGNGAALLDVRGLRVAFRTGRHTSTEAVKGVSFSVPRNATVALVGESGSGKSVSALAVMGLLPGQARLDPASRILFGGRDLLALDARARRGLCGKDIGMIFQEPMSSLNPVLTVGHQIAEVLRQHMGMDRRAAHQRTLALLDEVGMPDPSLKIGAYPHQLSGGQQQRVMIAMAIACEPALLIADEPTTALDVTIQKQIMTLLADLQRRRAMSMLFITHDLALVGEIADHVVVMRHGAVCEEGGAQQVLHSPRDAYTRALLHCRPALQGRPLRLPVLADYLGGAAEGGPASQPEPAALPQRPRGYGAHDTPLLTVRGLSKSFFVRTGWWSRREIPALRDVSFDLPRGKTLGVVGESGSGKSTLGLTLLRLHGATAGSAVFEGRELLTLNRRDFMPYKRRMQIVFQNPYASLNPRFTVGQILLEPMRIHGIGAGDGARTALALQLLDRVGLPGAALQRYPHQFSGGQRQRIAIARCLTLRPDLLVCDESVSALDVSVQAQVLNLLQELQDELGISYLFISHDLAVVRYMADQVLVMKNGAVLEAGDADTVFGAPRHPYTQALLAAVPGSGAGKLR